MNLFKEHVEKVMRFAPQDKLLVIQVDEGWKPLCKFLGVDVPGTPSPFKNRSKAVHDKIDALKESGNKSIASSLLHS